MREKGRNVFTWPPEPKARRSNRRGRANKIKKDTAISAVSFFFPLATQVRPYLFPPSVAHQKADFSLGKLAALHI